MNCTKEVITVEPLYCGHPVSDIVHWGHACACPEEVPYRGIPLYTTVSSHVIGEGIELFLLYYRFLCFTSMFTGNNG